jgi:branched-chain amino acid transport system ATP-binding protein
MLEIEDLWVSYGSVEVLEGISLKVNKGEIVSLIGSNGAGKSTTLMAISGVIRPKRGKILFNSEDITGLAPHRVLQKGISHCPEGRRILPRLTVLENLELGAFKRGDKKRNIERAFGIFPILKERANQYGGTLSGGEQQMLALARALMSDPELLLLDEPSLGIAPVIVEKVFETIQAIRQEGLTILLVEQNAYAALALSDRAYVLENGIIRLQGRGAELLNNDEVRRAYLGECMI